MNRIVTKAVVLNRVNYADNDRILSIITKDHGKLSLIARGARKIKSKLAGSIELFTEFEATIMKGKGSLDNLISAKGINYFTNITKSLERMQVGYNLLKYIDKNTEPSEDELYYDVLIKALEELNNPNIITEKVEAYFISQLIKLSGFSPNLNTDINGDKLSEDNKYLFDTESMSFIERDKGIYDRNDIKILRILFSDSNEYIFKVSLEPKDLQKVNKLLQIMFKTHLSL